MRRVALLVTLVALVAVSAEANAGVSAPSQAPLAERLAAALRAPGLSPSRTGALVVDLRTGRVVYSLNPLLPLVPASNEKLAVTFAALEELGRGYRFRTEVAASGELGRNGTLDGALHLRGHGDPTLTAEDVRGLARQVRAWGIRRVTGGVVGDGGAFDGRTAAPGWKPSFVPTETPPIAALVVARAAAWPRLSPALEAATALDRELRRLGVKVGRRPTEGRTPDDVLPVAIDVSDPLLSILRTLNRDSDNFVAEMLLKTLGAEVGAGGTTAAGAAVVRRALAARGIPLTGVRIADGSGLSRHDRLTARAIVALVLTASADPELRDPFLSSLAVAGVSGTLERRLERRPTIGQVAAKTGTTSLASALSGVVRRRYAFAILQNGAPIPTWTARAAQDRFATVLAGRR